MGSVTLNEGKLDYSRDEVNISAMQRPATQVMMNVANPDEAFRLSLLPNDGVGLAREEFIVTASIGIHPKAMIEDDKPRDRVQQQKMNELTKSYTSKPEFFIERLSHGIAMLAAAFYPDGNGETVRTARGSSHESAYEVFFGYLQEDQL